jgi:hypothetical protein
VRVDEGLDLPCDFRGQGAAFVDDGLIDGERLHGRESNACRDELKCRARSLGTGIASLPSR